VRKRVNDEPEPTFALSLATETFLAEAIYDPETKDQCFLVYRFEEDGIESAPSLKVDGTDYQPQIPTSLVQKGVSLTSTNYEEYGTTHDLFARIRAYIGKYVFLPNDPAGIYLTLFALYAMMTWVADRLDAVPYLRFLGDWGSAKSRLLVAIGHVCYRAFFASGATTPSPLFRALDRYQPTMILDEADFSHRDEYWPEITLVQIGSENE
jgi:hypothetical protein